MSILCFITHESCILLYNYSVIFCSYYNMTCYNSLSWLLQLLLLKKEMDYI